MEKIKEEVRIAALYKKNKLSIIFHSEKGIASKTHAL